MRVAARHASSPHEHAPALPRHARDAQVPRDEAAALSAEVAGLEAEDHDLLLLATSLGKQESALQQQLVQLEVHACGLCGDSVAGGRRRQQAAGCPAL